MMQFECEMIDCILTWSKYDLRILFQSLKNSALNLTLLFFFHHREKYFVAKRSEYGTFRYSRHDPMYISF